MEGPKKRQKMSHIDPKEQMKEAQRKEVEEEKKEVRIMFKDVEGNEVGYEISVDASFSKIDLNKMLDQILQNEEKQVY